MQDDKAAQDVFSSIERPLRLTLAGLWAERLTRAFWPLWTLVLGTFAALAFGAQDTLPIEVVWPALILSGLAGLAMAWRGWRAFVVPTRTDALIRLDTRLPGRPLAALTDTQVIGADDPASLALWQAHRARMAARAAGAVAVEPDLRLAARDPFALRYVVLTAAVMALIFGSVWRVTSVQALSPGTGRSAAVGPAWEGWADPPAYTRKPAIYLNTLADGRLEVPVGTRLQFRLYGKVGDLTLSETVSQRTDVAAASDPVQDFTLRQSGRIAIDGAGGRAWNVVALPDTPPSIAPAGPITRMGDGKARVPFRASDDYGVVAGRMVVTLDLPAVTRSYGLSIDPEPREALVADLPLPLRGNRAAFDDALVQDFSEHPFANLPVTLRLEATDAIGQTGQSAEVHVVLPGRRFFDPMAAALIELRRDMLWNRANATRSAQVLRALLWQPPGQVGTASDALTPDPKVAKLLRAVVTRLDAAGADITPDLRDQAAGALWQIALMIEDGKLGDALARLRRAQDRVDQALQNGADPAELDQLMQDLRQATNDYLRQLGKDASSGLDEPGQQGPSQNVTQDQIQQMMDRIKELSAQGRTAEAQDLANQLRQLLENLKVTQGGPGQPGQPGAPGQGGQAMRDLQGTLRDQQGLSDQAFRGMQGDDSTDSGDLANRQQELSKRLNQLGRGALPGDGTQTGDAARQALKDAGRAMDDAEQALRDGDLPRALDRQADAMEAMRNSLRGMAEAEAREQAQSDGQTDSSRTGQTDPGSQADPLGREPGDGARIGSDRNGLPQGDVYARAQQLLDEIRRRAGDAARPDDERGYLRRLLDLF